MQAESLNKIWKREGKGESFKVFAENYNSKKKAEQNKREIKFNHFSNQHKPVRFKNVTGDTDPAGSTVTEDVKEVTSTVQANALALILGLAAGAVVTYLILKKQSNG